VRDSLGADRAAPPGGLGKGAPALEAGWAALALAAGVLAWVVVPLAGVGGPDLASLRRPAEGGAPGGGAGGSTGGPQAGFPAPRPPKMAPASPMELNRATVAELATLPGIGPALAARIVAHRQAVGPFPRPAALRGVPGIGPKRYERLAPHLVVRAAPGAGPEAGGRPGAAGAPPGEGDGP
jgi:competence protein ComEA